MDWKEYVRAKSALHQSKGSAAAIIMACCCLLGCLPVAGFGLASAVAYYFQLEDWVAQLAIGGGLSMLSIAVAAICFKNVTRVSQFKRSSEEFSKNLEWTKSVFDGDSNCPSESIFPYVPSFAVGRTIINQGG